MSHQPDHAPGAAFAGGSYRPDPAEETRLVVESFFDALTAAVPEAPDLGRRLRRRHRELVDGQQARIVDEPSRHNLAMTLAVLAGYQELGGSDAGDVLIPRLEQAFVGPLRPFVLQVTAAALDGAADAFAEMVAICKEREQKSFGRAFEFRHPADDAATYVADVRRCFYHDVLAANGAAELTPIFCAFDANWADAIDPARHGFTFERRSTIGTGGATCPFTFRRNEEEARS